MFQINDKIYGYFSPAMGKKTLKNVFFPWQSVFFFVSVFIFAISGCKNNNEYIVTISSIDPETKISSEKKIDFTAKNDTAAFVKGCEVYWKKKTVALQSNKDFSKIETYKPLPVPFHFSVTTSSGALIHYPADQAERITAETVAYFKEMVLPVIDSLQPKKNTETPNIY